MFDGMRALGKGFWTVLRHAAQPPITFSYPEVKRRLPAAFRSRHRLFRHEDGLERCIAPPPVRRVLFTYAAPITRPLLRCRLASGSPRCTRST